MPPKNANDNSAKDSAQDSLKKLREDVIACERCPRLRRYCTQIAKEKRKSFQSWDYWGRPVPDFAPVAAQSKTLLIVGLAPAAHGANRTGRMFTGDRSGEWLFRALHKSGFASNATYERADDGLELLGCVITAVTHCAPPDNKPLPIEIKRCSEYLQRSFEIHNPRVVIALGGLAWKALFSDLKTRGLWRVATPAFAHGAEQSIGNQTCLASYHPSQQNTFTGRLTEPMFDAVFARAKTLLKK